MRSNKKRGRPYAITKVKEDRLIELISDGISQAKACKAIGISQETACKHKKRFPEFTERLEASLMRTDLLAHRSLKAGMIRDWRAGAWWLERRYPEEFKERKDFSSDDKPILIADIF